MEEDITQVVRMRYEAPLMCFGKTCAGRRCKIRSMNSIKCYGIEFPVCKHHENQNAIYKWSLSRSMMHVPDKIKSYLIFYQHCTRLGMDEWLSVVVAAELYKTKAFLNSEQLLQLFRNIVFANTEGECSVCYDTGPALRTRCGHVFCELCLTNWTHSHITCPMCRKIISQA
jgi:hypothetical protein